MTETIKKKVLRVEVLTAISVAIALIIWTACGVNIIRDIDVRFEQVEASVRHLDGKTDLYTERYDETLARQSQTEIELAKIQVELKNIVALILEIKTELKK